VAFVDGPTVRFFVADGNKVDQVAEVSHRAGMDVRDVVALGNMLSEALHLNGDAPAPAPRAKAAAPKPAAPKQKPRAQSLNYAEVLAPLADGEMVRRWMRAGHEGASIRQFAEGFLGLDLAHRHLPGALRMAISDRVAKLGLFSRVERREGELGAAPRRYYTYDPA